MSDYYEILGLSPSADAALIKAAYKRLAMQYHPDRNMGDKNAEEMFKRINEAYHVLSDPLKKSRYDDRFRISSTSLEGDYRRDYTRRPYYQPRPAQPRSYYYKVDKNYFKIQGLAVLVFFAFASVCFGIAHTVSYFIEKQRMEEWMANTRKLQQVNGLFESGRFTEAFDLILSLRTQDPTEFRFTFAKDSLIGALGRKASVKYEQGDYASAVEHLLILKNYENPVQLETLRKIAYCQYHLGNYQEAAQALKHLHNQQPQNLELVYRIGLINLEKLENREEALRYFDLGKKLFKENLTKVYGEAFEIVMDPLDAPDIYFEMFIARAKTNLDMSRSDDAITDGNWAVFLRRSRPEGYYMRALAKIQTRKFREACEDLGRARQLGSDQTLALLQKHCR